MHHPQPGEPAPDPKPATGARPVLLQQWNELFFLHWEQPADLLRARLPEGLTLDEHDGRSYVGLVGFRMEAVRPRGLPAVPWLSFFLELNVRLYVRDVSGRPGVFFLSLDCNRAIPVEIARAFFSLPYQHAGMGFEASDGESHLWCRRRGLRTEVARYGWRPASGARISGIGTLEFHLLERYRFFTRHRGILQEGRVHHAPYQASQALLTHWSALPLAWNGLPIPDRPPDLAHCCAGVTVEAFALRPVPGPWDPDRPQRSVRARPTGPA